MPLMTMVSHMRVREEQNLSIAHVLWSKSSQHLGTSCCRPLRSVAQFLTSVSQSRWSGLRGARKPSLLIRSRVEAVSKLPPSLQTIWYLWRFKMLFLNIEYILSGFHLFLLFLPNIFLSFSEKPAESRFFHLIKSWDLENKKIMNHNPFSPYYWQNKNLI